MKLFFSILSLMFISACSVPPYIHKPGEYNRESATFGQQVDDISSVTICYRSSSSTPQQVNKLARDECARFNKTAVFFKQSYQTCPLAAPVAAIYDCEGPEDGSTFVDGQKVPGGTLMIYDGMKFSY